jgi:hypothetical protein
MKLILQAIKALFRKVENRIEDVRKSIPEVAQADWSQNDGTKPDYVKNRTHYAEKAFEDIIWDGDTEGRDIGYINDNNIFYKVSDKILSVEDLIEATAVYTNGTVHQLDEDRVRQESEDLINIDLNAGVVILAPTTYRGTVFSSTGVYFLLNNGTYHITGLKAKETVHKLDAKYLPDGIGGGGAYYLFFNGQSGDIFIAPGTYAAIKDAIENKKFVDFKTATWGHGNGEGDYISYSVLDRVILGNDGIIHGTCDKQTYVFTINPDDTGTWFYDN